MLQFFLSSTKEKNNCQERIVRNSFVSGAIKPSEEQLNNPIEVGVEVRGRLGISSSLRVYIEGESSEFFQV